MAFGEGPVGLSALLFLSALLAARRALDAESGRRAAAWAALAGLVLFLGLWVKLVFAWWLPALALFQLYLAARVALRLGLLASQVDLHAASGTARAR